MVAAYRRDGAVPSITKGALKAAGSAQAGSDGMAQGPANVQPELGCVGSVLVLVKARSPG